jgi:hypothetical protein
MLSKPRVLVHSWDSKSRPSVYELGALTSFLFHGYDCLSPRLLVEGEGSESICIVVTMSGIV